MSAPFGPGCPHYEALERFGPANVKWCEERVCGWINEPSNAWSNLGYLAAGLWILSHARQRRSPAGQAFGAAVIVMGCLSFYYHATNNFLTQALDFLGMFLSLFFIIAVNARRAGWPRRGLEAAYLGACAAATLALWPAHSAGLAVQWTVFFTGLAILATELAARRKEGSDQSPRWLAAAVVTLIVAEACSLADLKRFWCQPQSWLQGHAAWHVISAAAFPMMYRHYAGHFDRAWARKA
jgi:hypothetical protein